MGDLRRAGELIDEAVAFAERVGHVSFLRFGRANQIEGLFQAGRWDEALDACESFLAELDPDSPYYQEGSVRLSRARIRLARGDTAGALADCDSALEQARAAREPQILDASLPLFGLIYLEAGRRELAEAIADELAGTDSQPQTVFDLALLLAELERPRDAAAAVESIRLPTRWVDAARAYLAGDLVEAADVLFDIGELSLEAYVRLRAAERLVDDGKHAEGREQLDRALAFYRSVRAGRYLARGEALLSAAS